MEKITITIQVGGETYSFSIEEFEPTPVTSAYLGNTVTNTINRHFDLPLSTMSKE